jgi:hypothetical protein
MRPYQFRLESRAGFIAGAASRTRTDLPRRARVATACTAPGASGAVLWTDVIVSRGD